MLKNFNSEIFNFINATPESPEWIVIFARFIATNLIGIIPFVMLILWFWGLREQRYLVTKIIIATIIGLLSSKLLSYIFPHNRPFVDHIGYNFLYHISDNSFPSDHATVIFTFSLAFLFWHYIWIGIILLNFAVAIAWSRIYLGVHWPLDIIGSFLLSPIVCLCAQFLWNLFGLVLHSKLEKIYYFCFSIPIRKGWIRN